MADKIFNVLITGANSYVGTSFERYAIDRHKNNTEFHITTLDVQNDDWKTFDFSPYDAIFHVAGLAHRKITPDIEPLYYSVNCDLAVNIAKRAKESGVNHFIFMSSMSVYSDDVTVVTPSSPKKPDNAYGKGKLMAEQKLTSLVDDHFKVALLRPPMIYGKGCKGNYNSLRSIALKFPTFPKVNNKRSMIYIDNLSEFVCEVIEDEITGVLCPQNKELVNTSEWARFIALNNGKKLHLSSFLGWCAGVGKHLPGIGTYCVKAFGDCYYEMSMSGDVEKYNVCDFEESISETEE